MLDVCAPRRSVTAGVLACALVVATLASSAGHAAAGNACQVQDAAFLAKGGDADWSPVNNTIVYDTANDPGYREGHASTAIYQIHTIKPDGSKDTCISCSGQGVPAANLDKF